METGLIMGGLDYTEESTPFECRMGWAVDLNKASFQGRSALETLKNRPRRKLVSVVLHVDDGEFSGSRLLNGDVEVGMVPMVVPSPQLGGKMLGLASVAADMAVVGTKLAIADQPGIVAEIVTMPVYEADRKRVRS
jgi:aminomethyltransferase